MARKEEVGRTTLKTLRSLSVEEGRNSYSLMREREESIDLPCSDFPDHPEELHTRPVVKSGWLDKTPPKGGRRFQRRWVRVDPEYLTYFQNNKEVYSKRIVSLQCVSLVQPVGDHRFELVTQSRTFLFRAETNQQQADWVNCLQKLLAQQQKSGESMFFKSSVVVTEGLLDMMSPRTKVYCVIKDHRVYLFKTQQEYLNGIGVTEIDLQRSSVKDSSRSFTIITPYRTFSFGVDSEAERWRWSMCLSECLTSVPAVGMRDSRQTAKMELLQHNMRPHAGVSEAMSVHSHSGYLFKVASSNRPITEHKPRADFSSRWCSLDAGVFSYYKNEQKSSRCGSMKTSDIICLSFNSTENHGYEHTFELYTDGGRVYLFGADDINIIKEWMKAITMAVLPSVLSSVCGMGDRLGRLHCAEGSSGIGWFCLSGSRLQVLLHDSVEDIDLRKLHTLTVSDGVGGVMLGWRKGCVQVCYDRRPHFPGWLSSFQRAAGSGTETLPLQQLTESGIPISIQRCIDHITRHGLMSVGIYRKCGTNSRISTLLVNFLQNARSVCVSGEFSVDDVANTLKRFFREVKDGVFNGTENTHNWLSVTDLTDLSAKTSQYKTLLSKLPEVNRDTLKVLLNHLLCVQNLSDVNQMTTRNLGIVFGPTLFQTDGIDPRTSGVIEDLINNYCAIFNVSEVELQKQLDATSLILKKLSDQSSVKLSPSHTICAVYLEKKDEGAELLLQVGVSLTAGQLVLEVLELRGIHPPAGEMWSCWEIQEKDELERELHYEETVLPVYFSLGSESHMLVRKSPYSSDIRNYLNGKAEVCKLGTLRVCEVKGEKNRNFISRCCELNHSTFKLYRDTQGSQCEKDWSIKELKIYQSYRSKLHPPTPWGLTLVADGRQQWYLCCENEDEMIEWLATFLSLQHGGNLWMK